MISLTKNTISVTAGSPAHPVRDRRGVTGYETSRRALRSRFSATARAAVLVVAACCFAPALQAEAAQRNFATGSLIIPMDTDTSGNHASFNQNLGMWKAYGLVYRLLQNGIPVHWAIEPGKSFNDVDFTAASASDARTGTPLSAWSYRGGPFVIDSTYAPAALPIIQAWWAAQGNQPNVHEADADFVATVDVLLRRQPTIANESINSGIAVAYYNVAGIPDLNGNAWSSLSPNILTQEQIAAGALFQQGVCSQRRFDIFVTPHNSGYSYSLTDPNNLGTRTYAELDRFVHQGGGWTAMCHSILSNENNFVNLTTNGSAAVKALFATSRPGGQPGGLLTYGGFSTISNVGGLWTVDAADLPVAQAVSTTVAQALPGGSVQSWPAPPAAGAPAYYPETERVAHFEAGITDYDHVIAGSYHNGTGLGKITFIGGHSYSTAVPYAGNFEAPYLRDFYNSLFFNGAAVARLDLTYAPATFPQNGTGLLSLSVTNTGGSSALSVGAAPGSVSITLNPGFTYVSTTLGPAPAVTPNSPAAGYTTVTWTDLDDIVAGDSAVTINVQVGGSVSGTLGIKQLGTFHATYGDELGEGFTADDCSQIQITPVPAPTLTKTPALQGPVFTGDLVSWTLAYGNTGSAALQNAVLEDVLPPGFVFASASPAATTVIPAGSPIVRWNLGTLAPGASGSVTLTARAGAVTAGTGDPATQFFTNQAELRGQDAGGTSYTADASADVSVQALPLSIDKTVDQSFVASLPGTVTYTLTPRFVGDSELQNVRVIDPLPAGTSYVAASANAGGSFGAYVPIAAVPGNDPGPPVLDTSIAVSTNFVSQGGSVNVTFNVKSSVAVTGVSPSTLAVYGGAATCSGPTPATANVPAGGAGVNFAWTCTLAGTGEFLFSADASDALGTTAWPAASSASVLSASDGGPNVVTWNLGSVLPQVPGETITSGYTAGVYAFRGAGTNSFQKYAINGDAWTAKANALQNISKGGALASNGNGIIYGLRGGTQQSFYSYDIATNTWTARANTGANVGEGGALVFLNVAGTDYVYALMGNGTTGFRRYNVTTNTWTAMAAAPANVKKGGALTTDGTNLYAFRGDTRSDFWRYNVASNTWTTLASAPGTIGWGGSLTRVGGFIYALRGNGQKSFYRYEIATNTWTSMANTPGNVADGGALTTDGVSIYAFQGKTTSFWRYDIATNSWTSRALFPAATGQGGALVYVPGVNPQGRFTTMEVDPTLATPGVPITIRLQFESSTAVSNVVPGAPVVTATSGASCSSLVGPTLISADDDIAGSADPVVFEWTCTPSAGALPGSLRFSAGGTGAGAVAFPSATSKSVLVSPLLSYQATLPIGAPSPVVNSALLIGSGLSVSSAPVITNSGSPLLSIVKSNVPDASAVLLPGNPISYTMLVQNIGAGNATGVVVTDTVPAGTSYVGCSGGTSCSEALGAVTWNVGTLLPGQTATVSFVASVRTDLVVSQSPYVISNTASVASGQTAAINSNTVTNQVALAPTITKMVSPAEAATGDTLTYTLVVENPGAAFTGDVTDPVPAGTSFNGVGSCSPACTLNGNTVTWGAGVVQSGSNVFTFTVTVTASGGALVTNAAVLDPTVPDLDPVPSNEVQTPIGPELSLVKFNGPTGEVSTGDSILYSLVLTNESAVMAVNVVVSDAVPAGTSYAACTTPSGTCGMAGGTVTWNPGNLAAGASIVLTFQANVGTLPPGTLQIDNVAFARADNSTTPVPSNLVSNPVQGASSLELLLDKLAVPGAHQAVGDQIDYVYDLTNIGIGTLLGPITVSDDKVAVTCPPGDLLAGATLTCTATYVMTQADVDAGLVTNIATGTAANGGDPVSSNPDTETVVLENPQADLSMQKDDGSAVYVPGGSLTYTITVSNFGPNAVTGATVSDAFPPEINNATWTCSGSGGGSCTASGSGDISDTAVNLPVGASVTYLVNVDVIAGANVDPLVNTASVSPPPGVIDPLPGNNTDDDQDARAAAPSSIGDRLWLDEDGDGVQDAGEDGIAGVTVWLYASDGTTLLQTTTTDTDGRYIFTNVAAGTYVVRVDASTMDAGLAANPTYDLDGTGSANQATITVAAGVFDDTADFGYNWVAASTSSSPSAGATGAIGDRIWNDADMDGVQDFGEAGIPNVTVRLLSDDNGDGVYGGAGDNAPLTTTTDASGHYIFDGITAGAYVIDLVTATLPVGYSTTPTGDPDGDGDSTTNPIVLAPGDVYVSGDFGYPLPTGHDIGSSIFVDADADGVHDPGEPGLAGVTVTLLDDNGDIVASTVSDANGNYLFAGLPDGTYTVVVTDTANVLADVSTNTADPDGGFDRLSTVTLSGADQLTQDFGFAPAGHDTGDGLIGDTIFLDRNSSGTADPGEGMQGVTVNLYASDGTTLIASVTTDVNGQYFFGGLDPNDTYVVKVDHATLPNGGAGFASSVDPDGGLDEQAAVDLTAFANGITFDQDFAYEADTSNSIGGTIFNDANGDGTFGGGETGGYAGVIVILHDQYGNVVGTTTTDASGNYRFDQLPGGTYTIEVSEAGNVLGGLSKSDGTNSGADNNSQVAGYTVTVGGGVTDTTGDFGYFAPGAALGNFIFQDDDNDGVQDPTETGIAGVEITLTITYPNGDVTTVVTTSDANGAYSFGNLLLDETFDGVGGGEPIYVISVTTPSGYQASPIGQGGNAQLDSNDPAGSSATPVEGQTNSTDDALASNGIDFGFTPMTDLSIVKVGPGAVTPGTNLVYTILVTNNGSFDALDVSVTDPTPSGLTFVSNTGDCTGPFPCDLATVEAGATRTITATYLVPLAYTTPAPIVNVATVSSATTPDPVPANNSDDASTTLSALQADLSVVKAGPVSATPGTNVVFTVVVTNNGPNAATLTTVTDPTPGGLTFLSNTGDCVGAYPCSLGTIASGDTRTITSTYLVPASYAGPNPVVNTALVSSAEADPNPSDNTSSASVPLSPLADLAVVKTGPASAFSGSTVVFTVAVTNLGPSNAANVIVADPTPSGLAFVSNTGACTTAYPCSLGSVAAGATLTITTTYTVPLGYTSPDPIVNTATVSSSTPDPVPGNDTSTVSVPLVPGVDLSVIKSDSGTGATRGGNVTYTIVVTNNGPSTATSVTAVDTLDVGTSYVSDTGNCVESPAGVLSCPLGSLVAGASTSFTVTVSVAADARYSGTRENGTCTGAEDLCNSVTVSSAQPDISPANNTDTEPTNVMVADLMVSKSDSGAGVNRLEDFAYTLVVTNVGAIPATNVTVVDTLDVNTTYVADDGGCVEAPAGVLTCAVGTLAPGASSTIHVIVKAGAAAPTNSGRESGACNGSEDLCNSVTVTANEGDANAANNTDDEPTNVSVVNPVVDLSITKSGATDPVQAGAFTVYTISVGNAGPSAAHEVQVVDILDPNMTYVGGSLPCSENPSGMLTCAVGDLAAGATIDFTIIVQVSPAAPTSGSATGSPCTGLEDMCNRASVSSPETDSNPANNVDEVATDVIATTTVSELSIVKSDLATEPVLPGSNVTYRIVVTNAGPNDASNVIVYETLDPYMAYVSDTANCSVVTVPGTASTALECALGTIAAGSSAVVDVVVTIAANAPVDSLVQDGDCDDLEDVCNDALVTTSSADFNVANNHDSEPTDVSAIATCSDGVVDAGEECDPPDAEVCNNGVDDDGDFAIDCADPSCQVPGFQSCDGNCQLAAACLPILRDPALISWNRVYIHGRFFPAGNPDPGLEGFKFVLSNGNGEIYSATLLPGDMKAKIGRKVSRWTWKDSAAKRGGGVRDGLYRVGIHQRLEEGQTSYVFSVRGYGDMSKAMDPNMTSQIYIGTHVAYLQADWLGKPGAWFLTLEAAGQ